MHNSLKERNNGERTMNKTVGLQIYAKQTSTKLMIGKESRYHVDKA
jgi:hypothetical protein